MKESGLTNGIFLADGFSLARFTHEFGEDAIKCWKDSMQQGKAILKAAGASEVWHGNHARMHSLGGTIMGRSPDKSVANGYGQTHDVDNLFVAGPGLFPTTGAVNPTFTLSALALRTSQHLISTWSKFV